MGEPNADTVSENEHVGLTEASILSVARGALITSAAGACVTASYALLRGRGPRIARMYAIDSSVNCAIAGATFFSVKNYWVDPLSVKQQAATDAEQVTSLWNLRTAGLLETAISGAVTGGLFGWRRYSLVRGFLPGTVAGAAFCSLIQLSINEAGIQRLKYISKQRLGVSQSPAEPDQQPKVKRPFLMRFMGWLGVKQVSPEEYLEKLRLERDLVWMEILRLEEEECTKVGEERALPPTEDERRLV